jgi:hypothetical protein
MITPEAYSAAGLRCFPVEGILELDAVTVEVERLTAGDASLERAA